MLVPQYHRFTVTILPKPYISESGIHFKSTAIISFFKSDNSLITSIDFGHIETEEIYQYIEQHNILDVRDCYVKNFSFTAYRRTRLINKVDTVTLDEIKAQGAFFDSHFQTDFSYIEVKQADFSDAHFTMGNLNFSHSAFLHNQALFNGTHFNCLNTDFSNIRFAEGVSFKNATFAEGIKNFQYAEFGQGSVSFVNTEFGGGETLFLNSHFGTGEISFKVARFGNGKVDFHYSKFSMGDISFERTDFGNSEVDFRKVEFNTGKVNFNRATFGNGNVLFEACSAEGRLTFKKAEFGDGMLSFELCEMQNGALDMEKCSFGQRRITFLGSIINFISLKSCQLDNYIDMRVQQSTEIDLSNTVVRDIIDLQPFEFDVKVHTLNITGMRLLGNIYIDWHKNNVENLIKNQKNTTLFEKAEQYRTLKESFNKTGQYSDEDQAYVWFKRFEMRALYVLHSKKNKLNVIWNAPVYAFKKVLFDYAGLFATNPVRVMLSMVTIYATISLFYAGCVALEWGNIVSGLGGQHGELGVLGRSFFFSGITFLTIGYGDFYPMGIIRVLSIFEGFIGVFLMSYFTVAFVRKILR